ncbi:hypothetical protein MKW98_003907, partial [Papaver atlanticum]
LTELIVFILKHITSADGTNFFDLLQQVMQKYILCDANPLMTYLEYIFCTWSMQFLIILHVLILMKAQIFKYLKPYT